MSGLIFPAIRGIFKTAIEKNKQNISTCAVGSTRHPQGWQGLLRIGKNGGAYVVIHTFGRRIAVYFIPAIIVLIVVINVISNSIYYTWFLRESQQNIKGIVKQVNYTMDLYFQDIKTTVALLAENDELVYMLSNYDKMSIQERFYTQEEVDRSFRNTSLMRNHILDCIA